MEDLRQSRQDRRDHERLRKDHALTAATALTDSPTSFIGMRVATAVGASGVVPISLARIADLFPFERRGWALGWLFGGMAGGSLWAPRGVR